MKFEANDYFLSADNPIATADQRDIEALAMRILARPEVQQAKKHAAFLWSAVEQNMSEEARALFDAAMDEYAFNYIIKAVNSDANYPRIVQNFIPRHTWFGMEVPGARLGGDNPDNGYRLIPVEHGARYQLHGHRFGNGPVDVTYTIVANNSTSKTLSSLEGRDVVVDADGRFVITVDGRPAEGRINHLQTKRGAKWLFVRDSLGDWVNEKSNALRVRRLDPPTAEPIDEDEIAYRAATIMVEDVPITYWFTRLNTGRPANLLTAPVGTGGVGGLVSQVNSISLLRLADDEAFVVTINPGGAAYRNFVVHDFWYRSIEYWKRTSSLNNAQMLPNEDGSYTYVVSLHDPGVHNWIDTGGLHEVYALQRWQGVPRVLPETGGPASRGQLVKRKDLVSVLPRNTPTVTAAERRTQIEDRQAAWLKRLLDR